MGKGLRNMDFAEKVPTLIPKPKPYYGLGVCLDMCVGVDEGSGYMADACGSCFMLKTVLIQLLGS